MQNVSVGLVLYNNHPSEILQCLNSLNAQTAVSFINKLLIRDHSSDGLEYVTQWMKNHTINFAVQQWRGDNIGFGAGHNFLVQQITDNTEGYLCLNPDGVMHPKCLQTLLEKMAKEGKQNIFEAQQEPIMHPKFYQPRTGVTDWCSGACLLIPLKLYREIQGFDEIFFLYCEDVDLSWRVKAKGGQCFTVPEALFLHYTFDRDRPDIAIEMWKSAAILAHKWDSKKFKKQAFNVLSSLADFNSLELDKIIVGVKKLTLKEIYKANPNFKNGLVFSDPMWT